MLFEIVYKSFIGRPIKTTGQLIFVFFFENYNKLEIAQFYWFSIAFHLNIKEQMFLHLVTQRLDNKKTFQLKANCPLANRCLGWGLR